MFRSTLDRGESIGIFKYGIFSSCSPDSNNACDWGLPSTAVPF